MDETLTIYQQYMLEEIIYHIGTQPYIIMCSDDNEVLNKCVEEIIKRIEAIKVLYDYPHLWSEYTTPEYLTRILTVEYKSIILMNFDKMIEERINSNLERYNADNIDNFFDLSRDIYNCAVFDQMIGYREFLCNASMIVPCSNKSKSAYTHDLWNYAEVFRLDEAKELYCRLRKGENEDEMKIKIKRLRNIDYNARYKDRIKNHLWSYDGRK